MEFRILAGACVIKNSKVLLLKQSTKVRHPNKWGPPGGHLEKNEAPTETCIREVKEEAGINVAINGVVECAIQGKIDKELILVVLYHATPKSSNIKIDKDEISDYTWASLKEIKNDKYPLRNPMLKKILIRSLTEKPLPVNALQIYP
jgi:8-oxo-dGTP pyrophosphatase MutT (NUDIX family)